MKNRVYPLVRFKTLVCGGDPAGLLPLRRGFLFIPLVLICFAFLPRAQAVPVDGDIGGGNTAEGFNALFFLPGAGGGFNSGFGWFSGAFNTTRILQYLYWCRIARPQRNGKFQYRSRHCSTIAQPRCQQQHGRWDRCVAQQ